MTTKNLFKAIEGSNFIASKIGGRKVYISCDAIDTETHVSFEVGKFDNFASLVHMLQEDYTADVLELVLNGRVADHNDGIFTLGDPDLCDGLALRFFIYNK